LKSLKIEQNSKKHQELFFYPLGYFFQKTLPINHVSSFFDHFQHTSLVYACLILHEWYRIT